MLRAGAKGTIEAGQDKEKALAARLERSGYLDLMPMMDGSIHYLRKDLGYDALLQFDKWVVEQANQAKLTARLSRSPAKLWAFMNSNLIVAVISAVIGYVLGKLT